MVFTVEIKDARKPDEPEVEVYLDTDAIDLLIKRLQLLKEHRSHSHLMTPSWAGNELTEEKLDPSNTLVNHMRLIFVPQ